jgi:hypothetical protein
VAVIVFYDNATQYETIFSRGDSARAAKRKKIISSAEIYMTGERRDKRYKSHFFFCPFQDGNKWKSLFNPSLDGRSSATFFFIVG